MIRHVQTRCSCGASIQFGDLATDADLDAWSAEHGAHDAIRLEAPVCQVEPVYGGDVVLGLSVLGPHEVFPVLRGRAVILRFFGAPSVATINAVFLDLAAAGATVLGIEGGLDPMDAELPAPRIAGDPAPAT